MRKFFATKMLKICCKTYKRCNKSYKYPYFYYKYITMAQEIEHKFLVKNDDFKQLGKSTYYRQGYIPTVNGMTVRIRIAGTRGFITLKDHAVGITRHEFEYEIPLDEAKQMLELMCSKPQIEKTRYVIENVKGELPDGTPIEGLHWEVDVFSGDNEGLVVAEIEVPCEEAQFEHPAWLGEEVTGDHRYYNSALCKHPFKKW